MDGKYLEAVGTIVGTIVGAGILALPYAISKSGFLIGLALIIVVGVSSIFITLYTGELSFKLKKIHQLPILISKYTSAKLRSTVMSLQIFVIYGAIFAYLIAMGVSLQYVLGVPYDISVFLVFALAAPIIYKGYKAVEAAETPLSIIKILLLLVVSIVIIFSAKAANLGTLQPLNFLEPFGVILFALMSFTVVPEVREELGNKPEHFNKVVIIGTVISMAVYILFAAAFIGAFGQGVSSIATNSVNSGAYNILFYILTIFLVVTPYIALSLVVVDAFNFDFGLDRTKSFWLAVLVPFILALVGANFASVLGVVGGILLPILSLMILIAVYYERKRFRVNKVYRVPGGIATLIFTSIVMLAGFIYTLVYVVL
jgi:amino acid permease